MSYKNLMNDIKNNDIKSVYLLCGCETYLVNKAWDSIKNAVIKDYPELNYTLIEGEKVNAERLLEACDTFPFMSEKRMVVVRDLKLFKSSSKGEGSDVEASTDNKEVQSYIDVIGNLSETVCLVFVCNDSIDKRKKIVTEIKKYGALYEFDKVEDIELTKWIKNILNKSDKIVSPRELDCFIRLSGYLDKNNSKTLYDIENDLKRLVGFMGEEVQVLRAHIEAIMPRNIENDIFKLLNACTENRISDSLRIYNDLILEGEATLGILSLLSRQIKNIISVSELAEKRIDLRAISEKLKLHEYTVKLCVKYGEKIKKQILCNAFNKCLMTEMNIKTGKMTEKLALEMLLVSLFE